MIAHLITCESCQRQLDVTALKLGDQICCVCDHILTVGHPGGAPATDRLHQPALPPIPGKGECPLCEGDLRIHLLEQAEVIECSDCGGFWAQREAFMRMIRGVSSSPRAGEDANPSLARQRAEYAGAALAGSSSEILCVECAEPMRRRTFSYSDQDSRIMLDVCRKHGIWFDHAELQDTLKFVQGLGRPFDPAAVQLDVEDDPCPARGLQPLDLDGTPAVVAGATSEAMFFGTETLTEWTAEFALAALAALFD